MKDTFWVFKSFGFRAGILFVAGAISIKLKRLIGLAKKPKKFEELSDAEAREIASAYGIYPGQTRNMLNYQFNEQNENRTLH
jgi:hypothetical protein